MGRIEISPQNIYMSYDGGYNIVNITNDANGSGIGILDSVTDGSIHVATYRANKIEQHDGEKDNSLIFPNAGGTLATKEWVQDQNFGGNIDIEALKQELMEEFAIEIVR